MIVQEGNAATSNIESRHAFTIKASAKAFKLLSSNLYSDKPLAIVREIGCNALDSHFMAGKQDVPFKVVLPSDMHPWFEVIDYGTGLSDEQVKSVFTTYFESTKTSSNDQIGAMGLGSKSPFAYTDAFEVHARQNGVQNQYTCFLNQSGAPEIFLIETLTDPAFENGVTIKVPVKKSDYHLFRNAALKAYKFFPVKPIVGANTKDWEWNEPEYGFVGTNFKTIKNDPTIYALMGPVAYPLDLGQLAGSGREFVFQYNRATRRGFVIQYKIGDLDVNAGREGLSYDKTTIANLQAGLANIRDEMAKELTDGLAAVKNLYEAAKYVQDVDGNNIFNLKFNGVLVKTTLNYSFVSGVDGREEVLPFTKSGKWAEKLTKMRAHAVSINPKNDTFFVLIDDRKFYLKRIRYATERLDNAIYLMNPDTVSKTVDMSVFDKYIKQFEEHGTPYKKLSEIPYKFPERAKVEKDPNAPKPDKVSYSGFYHFKTPFFYPIAVREYKNLTDSELTGDHMYLLWSTKAKRLIINKYNFRCDEVTSCIWKMITEGAAAANKQIVIVTDKVMDKIPKNWVDVSTIVKANLKVVMSKKTFNSLYGNWVSTGVNMPLTSYEQIFANQKINPILKQMFDELRKIKFGDPLDYSTEMFFKNAFNASTEDTSVDQNMIKFKDTFLKQPLIIHAAGRYYGDWNTKDFSESLVVFSALIAHGVISETELKSYLK